MGSFTHAQVNSYIIFERDLGNGAAPIFPHNFIEMMRTMEIIYQKDQTELLKFLVQAKQSLKEWLFVEIRLMEGYNSSFTINDAAKLLYTLYKEREGKVYICNNHEILMLLRESGKHVVSHVTKTIKEYFPEGSCEVEVYEPTPEGMRKLELKFTSRKKEDLDRGEPIPFAGIRNLRQENVILVADDDMYIRSLVRTSINGKASVHEVSAGDEVLSSYKRLVPDVLFLDLHLPNKDGVGVLQEIMAIDPKAYVIILSSDIEREKVSLTLQKGAKGFLAKPFVKEKLQKYVQQCPTIR